MADLAALERITGRGLLVISDPHLTATSPGHRLPGFLEQIMEKLRFGLEYAAEHGYIPVILGDLFHLPRDNPNHMLVELIELFRAYRPFVLVGNHDKYQARYTGDVSMAVLDAAGVLRLMDTPGPRFVLVTDVGDVLVGASPDFSPIPKSILNYLTEEERERFTRVVWCTHHNVGFPEFEGNALKPYEIPGVDWVLNGHIHRPQPTLTRGTTRWANPGSLARMAFSHTAKKRVPSMFVWRPELADLEPVKVPYLPFCEVFPENELPPDTPETDGRVRESEFLKGLERLAWRRTREGAGLKDFLTANLDPETPEAEVVWALYQEVVRDGDR